MRRICMTMKLMFCTFHLIFKVVKMKKIEMDSICKKKKYMNC